MNLLARHTEGFYGKPFVVAEGDEREYVYETCCVDCPGPDAGEAIQEMSRVAVIVTYRTLQRHCRGIEGWAKSMGYAPDRRAGLTLAEDWAVGFRRSVFRGRPCYYVEHSRVEYLWTRKA